MALAAVALGSGCSGADSHGDAELRRPYTTAGLSSAKSACHQMEVHHYLRAAATINVATRQHTDQWTDLAQAVRTIAWSRSWAGDVGPHMSREEASNLIRTSCARVTRQTGGAAFAWTP